LVGVAEGEAQEGAGAGESIEDWASLDD